MELDGANAVKDSYLRGIGLLNSANKGYYNFNGHGDVVGITDSFGLVMQEYDYDVFGVLKSDNAGDDNPFRYCGEYLDLESGSVYLRNRNYSPAVGRFLTEDPIGSGLNWYVYCGNNPVAFIDPFGLEDYYIFYNDDTDRNPDGTVNNGSLQDRAQSEYKALIKSGVDKKDIYIKVISSEKIFAEEWGKMSNGDDPIKRVALYFHSNPRAIIINGIKACRRQNAYGMIFHSDRGSQYTSGDFRASLAKQGAIQSMSGTSRCYDNARMESFFATLYYKRRWMIDIHRLFSLGL